MAWWIAAALISFFIKGICGFANTLVFSAMLSFVSSNIDISPVSLMLSFPANAMMAVQERRSIRLKICLPLCALVIAGIIPGTMMLKHADTGLIRILFGAVVIALGVEMLIRDAHPAKGGQSRLMLVAIGVASGLLCGLYGIGALLSAYIGRVTKDSRSFKGNICFVFFVENAARVILYTATGILTLDVLRRSLMILPFALLGLWLGMRVSDRIDERIARKTVIIMLIASGAALILKAL